MSDLKCGIASCGEFVEMEVVEIGKSGNMLFEVWRGLVWRLMGK
jgi:hypothetical protein